MAFDAKGYYSRSVRDGDRVHRVYFGRGPAAQLAAGLDEQRRSERQARLLAWHAEQAARATAEARFRELDELSGLMMRATLLAAGYHRHDRGAWRRRRMQIDDAIDGMVQKPGTIHCDGEAMALDHDGNPGDRPAPVEEPGREDRLLTEGELRELLGRAEQGDRTVLPALRRLLDAAPELWNRCGDVARNAQAAWIDLLAGQDLVVRESLIRKIAALKAELAGPSAPPLERLLAERVAACWMQTAQADAAIIQHKGKGLTAAQVDLLQRRQERTQRSYLAAIKALATVRKLAMPSPTASASAAQQDDGRTRRQHRDETRGQDAGTSGTKNARAKVSKSQRKSKSASKRSAVPKALRDRMRGLAATEN